MPAFWEYPTPSNYPFHSKSTPPSMITYPYISDLHSKSMKIAFNIVEVIEQTWICIQTDRADRTDGQTDKWRRWNQYIPATTTIIIKLWQCQYSISDENSMNHSQDLHHPYKNQSTSNSIITNTPTLEASFHLYGVISQDLILQPGPLLLAIAAISLSCVWVCVVMLGPDLSIFSKMIQFLFCILIKVSQKFMSKGTIDNMFALIQVMAWCLFYQGPERKYQWWFI